jgi:RNA polymerase sigma factor (TIGR02999 family)
MEPEDPTARPPLSHAEVSALLEAHRRGDADALDRLMPAVYAELRRIAAYQLRAERGDHTLQPTALVHEAYLRLAGARAPAWQNRAHFFAAAAQVMRHILVDHARANRRDKRGGGLLRVALDDVVEPASGPEPDVVALDDALKSLSERDPRKSRIVEMRYFGGLEIEEVAEVLGVSATTVRREWTLAKAWLRREIRRGAPPD